MIGRNACRTSGGPLFFCITAAFVCLLLLCSCAEKRDGGHDRQSVSSPTTGTGTAPPPFRQIHTGGTEADQVKNLIMRYNELLVFGYANLNMTPLQEVTTERQAQKTYFHMAAIGEGGARMRSRPVKVDFTEVSFPVPGTARVRTREVWDFAYHDITTDRKNEEKKGFVYLMTYTLVKSEGQWRITDTSAVGEEGAVGRGIPR